MRNFLKNGETSTKQLASSLKGPMPCVLPFFACRDSLQPVQQPRLLGRKPNHPSPLLLVPTWVCAAGAPSKSSYFCHQFHYTQNLSHAGWENQSLGFSLASPPAFRALTACSCSHALGTERAKKMVLCTHIPLLHLPYGMFECSTLTPASMLALLGSPAPLPWSHPTSSIPQCRSLQQHCLAPHLAGWEFSLPARDQNCKTEEGKAQNSKINGVHLVDLLQTP